MIIALTGTPGTGKTSVAEALQSKGFEVVDLNQVVRNKGFLVGRDNKRASDIVDIEKLNKYILDNYSGKNVVFIEGHISHLLKSAEKIIVLRCHPDKLRKNLSKKGWNEEKIKENIEAEILDIILCETVEIHPKKNIFEINASDRSVEDILTLIIEIIKNKFKNIEKYKIGKIDWSEEILNDF